MADTVCLVLVHWALPDAESVSCLCHTTYISWMVSKALPYSRDGVFINMTSGHMLSRGSYSTTSISTDLNAACILLTKADLPSLPHQSACTPHTRLFTSSERKILHFQVLYSTCCDFIRLCFLNPWVEMGANSSLRRCKGRRGGRLQRREKSSKN